MKRAKIDLGYQFINRQSIQTQSHEKWLAETYFLTIMTMIYTFFIYIYVKGVWFGTSRFKRSYFLLNSEMTIVQYEEFCTRKKKIQKASRNFENKIHDLMSQHSNVVKKLVIRLECSLPGSMNDKWQCLFHVWIVIYYQKILCKSHLLWFNLNKRELWF